jgi:hypothetical protein
MNRVEFLNLFTDKTTVLQVIKDDFILRDLYEAITDFSDLNNSDVVNFLNMLGEKLGRDVIELVRNAKTVINKYRVPSEGKSVDEILREYASRHNGSVMWVGEVGVDFVELYVKDGELLV